MAKLLRIAPAGAAEDIQASIPRMRRAAADLRAKGIEDAALELERLADADAVRVRPSASN
jgi:hypothetical protein